MLPLVEIGLYPPDPIGHRDPPLFKDRRTLLQCTTRSPNDSAAAAGGRERPRGKKASSFVYLRSHRCGGGGAGKRERYGIISPRLWRQKRDGG